jgi:nucleotide-binding universal stress UspA family protein
MFAAFRTILVALDGGTGGLDAVALGALLAVPETRLTCVHVVTPAERADAADAARQAAGPGAEWLTVRADSVISGLRELVEARKVELLVVGSHHHHLASHDHTRDALRQLDCAIAVAPWGYAARQPPAIASIGLGYVDDRGGRLVLDAARGLAHQLGAQVRAMTIVAHSNWPDRDSGSGWRALDAARRMAEIPGIDATVVEGDPYHALHDLSRRVDLLVLGTHHRRALRRLLPRDVTEGLSHTAACPLIVVPDVA